MTPVPLLERQARISVSQALCLRVRERDHAADVVAHLPDVEPGRGDVPAEIRAELRIARRSTLTSSVSGTGLALNAAGWPAFQLFPGQLAPVGEVFSLKPPPPPPCVVLGT